MYDFNKMMSYYYFEWNKCIFFEKLARLTKSFVKLLIRTQKLDNYLGGEEFIFYNSCNRKDYNEFFEVVYQQCEYHKTKIKIINKFQLNTYNIRNFFKNISTLKCIKNLTYHTCGELFILKHIKISWPLTIYIYIKYMLLLELEYIFQKIQTKNIVVLADVRPEESMLISVGNNMGANTITLQHALFVEDKKYSSYDALNYTNVPSKYILSWGNRSAELFRKYNPLVNVQIVGNPLIKEEKNEIDNGTIGIVLDQPLMYNFNKILCDLGCSLSHKTGRKVRIRIHPADDKTKYHIDDEQMEFNSDLDGSSCILAHTSTMIYTYMLHGKKVIRLKSSLPANEIDPRYEIKNMEQLTNIFTNGLAFYDNSIAKEYISYTNKTSMNLYKEFFRLIKKDNLISV